MDFTIEWALQNPQMNTAGNNQQPTMTVDNSHNIYIAYMTDVTGSQTGTDIVLLKMDAKGSVVWKQAMPAFNTNRNDQNPCMAWWGGYLYLTFDTVGSSMNDIVVCKLNATDGSTVWVSQFESANYANIDISPTMAVNDLGIWVVYSSTKRDGSQDVVVFKLDHVFGRCLWCTQKDTYNTTTTNIDPQIGIDAAGNSYVAYRISGAIAGERQSGPNDIVVFKLGPDGIRLWMRQSGQFNVARAETDKDIALCVDPRGTYLYVAYCARGSAPRGFYSGGFDLVLFKMNCQYGSIAWLKQKAEFNTPLDERYPSLSLSPDGTILAVVYCTGGLIPGGGPTSRHRSGSDLAVALFQASDGKFRSVLQSDRLNTTADETAPCVRVIDAQTVAVAYCTTGVVHSNATSVNCIVTMGTTSVVAAYLRATRPLTVGAVRLISQTPQRFRQL